MLYVIKYSILYTPSKQQSHDIGWNTKHSMLRFCDMLNKKQRKITQNLSIAHCCRWSFLKTVRYE